MSAGIAVRSLRATLGASLLDRAGHRRLLVVDDGWNGWNALDHDHPR